MNTRGKPVEPGQFWPNRRFCRYWYLVGLFLLLAVFAFPFDFLIAEIVNADTVRGDAARVLKLSELFAHGFGIGVVLCGIWMLVPQKRRFLPRLVVCALLPGAIANTIKVFVSRKRPIEFYRDLPDSIWDTWMGWLPGKDGIGFNLEYANQAFPSAHAATVISFAIVLSWVFPRGRFLFFALAFLAAVQRVVFEAHWTSDILVGAAIGVMVGCAMTKNWGFGYWCGLWEYRAQPQLAQIQDASIVSRAKSA